MRTLVHYLKLLLLAPAALAIILFAVANRGAVTISLDPFSSGAPQLAWQAPLYAVALVAMALGILAGGAAAWFGQRGHRKALRSIRRETEALRAERERLRLNVPALPAPRS